MYLESPVWVLFRKIQENIKPSLITYIFEKLNFVDFDQKTSYFQVIIYYTLWHLISSYYMVMYNARTLLSSKKSNFNFDKLFIK